MALRCEAAFPMTEEEQATAKTLELKIDTLLRDAVRGVRPPVMYNRAFDNPRIRGYLVSQYVRVGWIVGYSERSHNPYLRFRPNIDSLRETESPQVIELIRRTWKH